MTRPADISQGGGTDCIVLLQYGVTAGLCACLFGDFLIDRGTIWLREFGAGGPESLGIFNLNLLGI